MTTQSMLIDICHRRGWALDINYLRGYVVLTKAQCLENAIQSF